MPSYKYVAVDASGRQVTGELQGADQREVTQRLRETGSFPVEVTEARESAAKVALTRSPEKRKVTRGDVAIFTRQLSDLIDAGMPLDRALTVLIEQAENPGLQTLLADVLQEVRGGEALSGTLAKYPRIFM